MATYRTILLGLFVLLGQDACWGEKLPPVNQWKSFTSKDGSMTVKFPGKPKIHTQRVPTAIGKLQIRLVIYESAAKDVALLISKVEYPIDPAKYDVQGGLKGAVQGVVSNVKGTLKSQEDIKMFGLPGKEIVVKTGKGPSLRSRILIDPKGPTLYQIQVVGSANFLKGAGANAFLDSFKIEGQKGKGNQGE